jgi:hypothetical protein
MLHEKMRHWALRLRYGVVALAIFAPLAATSSAAASVSTTPPTSPTPPPATYVAPQPASYDNSAKAISPYDYYHAFDLKFELRQSSPSVLTADNSATALTENCHDCGALAIGFQVVFVNDQNLTAINASNNADATSYACVRCTNMAEAYQIIVASDTQSQLTWEQTAALYRVDASLAALQRPGLTPDQIQSKSDALANLAVSIVSNPDYGISSAAGPLARTSALSPAINGAALPADLTSSTQPTVDLYVSVKVST